MTVQFTVTGQLRGVKRSLGPTPIRINLRVQTSDEHADTNVVLPVPPEAAAAIDELVRERMMDRVARLGHGGTATITVTIDDD